MVDRSRNRLRVTLASSSISGNAMKWKCRNSLAVIGFLPPPGGPIAATKFTSWIDHAVTKFSLKKVFKHGELYIPKQNIH